MHGINSFDQGSFITYAVWEELFLFEVPAGLAPEHPAPLMCAGAMVFEIIEGYNIRPMHRVGVVGIGGLGHLAVMFAAKMGAEVVVFSSSDAKRQEAFGLGASEFYATRGVGKVKNVRALDHLIVTTSFIPLGTPYMAVMKRKGTFYPLTVSEDNLSIPTLPLIMGGSTSRARVGLLGLCTGGCWNLRQGTH